MNCCIKKRIKSDDVFLDFVPSSTSHIQRMPCPLTRFSSDVASPCEALHKGPPSKTARRNSSPTATNCRACFLCSLSPTPREFLAFSFRREYLALPLTAGLTPNGSRQFSTMKNWCFRNWFLKAVLGQTPVGIVSKANAAKPPRPIIQ